MRERFVQWHGQHARTHRHFQHFAIETVRDTAHGHFQIVCIRSLVHIPYKPANSTARQGRAGNHPVIKRCFLAQILIGILDFIMSAHCILQIRVTTIECRL